ncbi:tripeptide aminopeptidase [Clostridium acetobutylicum]|uniref:Peptidase T n=1 Tax=Clostridium acetobutylicum (strain ATCC 824 / DSM 792 / JCM 1419 / IAM 19013 / LMG 5710 / NBRC 13948 / NRRL B-527 / VKM B-1787 / 2291 / W) TaxID=272562 RepID=PEPT_CLOAB|nr:MULTISPECIES: peptidase T [Clostridium]Q97LS8.1 RecName: Full=Peptidase T; AltName: Full=Aminotripeptidase; Short=Tripeptidase; AltName: Full=Tripeptide aminopeptidase [Clostridium acetobutylicum ATCC 824]AAK78456.1 Peptidase T (aminotripeptidase), gene pepT [Clostridium acetobutylicum ATCC 824]ADZ19526.1 peptidase T [Clostridium acetobutylicum EA 2018]AEI33488.1 peptidase T [Clostridium acetobutylicum DSM 1731]AWV80178.1 peptidase T [Clostridium acetobutylicum]MBC2392359.1 peptidase T [Cl
MEEVIERFLKYVKFDTQSDENSNTVPSTDKQLKLGKNLVEELKEIGLSGVSIDDNGYVMAYLPANIEKNVPALGFISHMDTSPDMSGENVNPQFVKNYDGNDIVLNKDKNIVLSPKDFPEILKYKGKTLITTDGNTLLGADDKAGIAEIITAISYISKHPEIKHGKICIGFTPDEEVGRGADYFDVKKFGADVAYTVDGGDFGELEYENFNAASAKITVHGRNVHPGSAKDKMINSISVAEEFMRLMPKEQAPEYTEGYEGFYHIVDFQGSVEETKLQYIIRDFSKNKFEDKKKLMLDAAKFINEKYGRNLVEIEVKDQYYNMKEKIDEVKYVVDIAYKAMEEVEVKPLVRPIRGGTDGARLSFMGLPTPNLFTGGVNFHGKFEYIPTFAMEKAVEVIVKIVELYAEK